MTSTNQPNQYNEKRKDIRHSCQKPAEVFIGAQRYSGYICNESKGGVFVEARGSFLAGDDVMVVELGHNPLSTNSSIPHTVLFSTFRIPNLNSLIPIIIQGRALVGRLGQSGVDGQVTFVGFF